MVLVINFEDFSDRFRGLGSPERYSWEGLYEIWDTISEVEKTHNGHVVLEDSVIFKSFTEYKDVSQYVKHNAITDGKVSHIHDIMNRENVLQIPDSDHFIVYHEDVLLDNLNRG